MNQLAPMHFHQHARVYDPNLGRFLQTDPVGYIEDLNLYAYVASDPLNTIDPIGKCGANFSDDQTYEDQCVGSWNAATSAPSRGQAGTASQGETAIQAHYSSFLGGSYTVDPQTMELEQAIDIGAQIQQSIDEGGQMARWVAEAQATGQPVSFSWGPKRFSPS